MTAKQITAGILSIVLAALLGWSFFAGVGDERLQVALGVGIALGLVYTAFGRLPPWMIALSGGKLTADGDPSNIPTRIYLPILIGVLVVAVIAVAVAVFAG